MMQKHTLGLTLTWSACTTGYRLAAILGEGCVETAIASMGCLRKEKSYEIAMFQLFIIMHYSACLFSCFFFLPRCYLSQFAPVYMLKN